MHCAHEAPQARKRSACRIRCSVSCARHSRSTVRDRALPVHPKWFHSTRRSTAELPNAWFYGVAHCAIQPLIAACYGTNYRNP